MKSGYAIFFDIDGTIYHNGEVSRENIEQINRVQRMGNHVFINTGRSRVRCPAQVTECGIAWDGFLCGYSYLEIHGKTYCDSVLPRATVEKALRYSSDYGIPLILDASARAFCTQKQLYDCDLISDTEIFLSDERSDRINKILFFDAEAMSREKALYALVPELDFLFVGSFSEGYIKGAKKSDLIEKAIKILGIPREKTIAFGDDENDLSMLEYAGTGILVRHEGTKDFLHAEIETDGEASVAVAEMLKKLFPTE